MLRSRCSITAMSRPMKQEWSRRRQFSKSRASWFVGWKKFPENKGLKKAKQRLFLNYCTKIQENKWFFWPDDWNSRETNGAFITARNPREISGFWPDDWNSQTTKVFLLTAEKQWCPKSWNLQHVQCIGDPNPGIYSMFSAGEDHIQESAALSALFSGHWRPRRGEKAPTPTVSALLRKWPVLSRADFVLTKDPRRFTTRPPPVYLNTQLPFVRPFTILSKTLHAWNYCF